MTTSSGTTAVASRPVNGHAPAAEPQGLDIVVVGAGIGGLTAAVYLRRNGHRVTLLEQSRFANELGAAVHLAPNANGILRRVGIYAEKLGANPMEYLTEYDLAGQQTRHVPLEEPNKMWQHPWLLCHRVHLHEELKRRALSTELEGPPAVLRTSSRVVAIDPYAASATLENGETVRGDLIIGADGVHSMARKAVPGGHVMSKPSGKSAFRFLVRRQAALDDPVTASFAQRKGELVIWYGPDRRVVMYPCADNSLLNFVCIHPREESEAKTDDWNSGANKAKLLRVYEKFSPALRALLDKADDETLKVWELMDMDVLPSWTCDRLALLGDAAHPFLPHQGQGAGVAMEDAASIAVVLAQGVTAADAAERLQLYESFRYARANRIQEYSRLAGRDLPAGEAGFDMMEYTMYNFGHDEWDHSMNLFRRWDWARKPHLYWRMPVGFGPMPGPRQDFEGRPRDATGSTFTTASIKFRTSRTLLQNLFPPGTAFAFSSPGTVAHASFSQTTLNGMAWLGGGGYRHLGLYVHGVQFTCKNGTVLRGTYLPLLFESLTDPIVTGREELGMPKLYCGIDVFRRGDRSYRIQAGWEGAPFATLALDDLVADAPAAVAAESGTIGGEADDGILAYKYVPRVGDRGRADVQHAVFVPHAAESRVVPSTVDRVLRARTASVRFDPLDWTALPTLHHVVARLAEIPVYEVVSAKVVTGRGVPDVSSAMRVD